MTFQERSTLLIAAPPEDRKVILNILENEWTIIEKENEEKAVQALKIHSREICCVLLGGTSEESFGLRLAGMIRELDIYTMPVLMMMSAHQETLFTRALELGADDVLIRPFVPELVRRRVRSCVLRDRNRRKLTMREADSFKQLMDTRQSYQQNADAIIDTMSALLEFRGYQPGFHVRRVRQIVWMLLSELAVKYELTPHRIAQLSTAAAMHDIGKIAVPSDILLQPDPLTPEQLEIIHRHTVMGYDILCRMNPDGRSRILLDAAQIALSHHERWNGSGYPNGLKGNEIPIAAQAAGLADVYDTLVNNRIYKGAYSADDANRIILDGAGIYFSEELIAAFESIRERLIEPPKSFPHIPVRMEQQIAVEEELRQIAIASNDYMQLSNLSGELVFYYNCHEQILRLSDAFCRTFNCSESERHFARQEMIHYLNTRVLTDHTGQIFRLTPEMPRVKMELHLSTSNGRLRWYDGYFYARYENGEIAAYYGKLVDIEQFHMEESHWQTEAITDPLTGLFNRAGIQEKAALLLAEGQPLSFFFLDLDDFKQINDTYGHGTGDQVLRYIAQQIKKRMRPEDLIGRIGGDEFLIVLPGDFDANGLSRRAGQLCEIFSGIHIKTGENGERSASIHLSGSIGVSLSPQDGQNYDVLLEKADNALYAAKQSGKNTWRFYSDQMASAEKHILSKID